MSIRVKDWDRFQHFKDRRPPWIKLYRDILDDMEWHDLDAEAAKALVMMWLIASENEGHLPDDKKLAFRLRISPEKCKLLISKLSHWLGQDDNDAISERYQDDRLERETETEEETETDAAPKAISLESVLVDYHTILPRCQKITAITDARKRAFRKAEINARRICKQRGWDYGADFWRDFFAECAKDEWLRGDRPNPNNPSWRQSLDVLLRDEHFAKVMDAALGDAT